MMERSQHRAVRIANIFGTLGYLTAIVEWSWVALIACYPILESQPTMFFPDSNSGNSIPPITIAPEFSPVVVIIAVISTTLILLSIVWVLLRLPKSIGRGSAKLSQKAAHRVMPVIARGKKLSTKKRQRLSYKIILALKVALVVLPLIVILPTGDNSPLAFQIAWAISLILSGFAALYFIVQALIVKLSRLDTSKVW